jgi:hypothetical protein
MINISYIRLLQQIESFCEAHMQINRFASDFAEQLPNFGTESEAYPILYVTPTSTIFDQNTNVFTVDIYCFDIIQKDRANINTILSDTNQILNDLHKWFLDDNVFGVDIQINNSVTPINNSLLDYAAGWVMTAAFTVDTYGSCEIPFSGSPSVITEVNDIVYSPYLTCNTLDSCQTIIDIQDSIDEIEVIIGNITGGTDTTVTGGTYNPSANTFTFTNNTGGTFTVSGNVLTQTSYDAYLGSRLTPTNTASNGFGITKNTNTEVGLKVKNTSTTGTGAIANVSVGGDGTFYENGLSMTFFGKNYYIPYLRNTGALYSTNDLNIININNSKIDFRTGNAFGSETSKFAISSGGTLSIGVRPAEDSTDDLLARKSDGSIVRTSKSGLTEPYVPYTGGTKDLILSANSITAGGGFYSTWTGGQFAVNPQVTTPFIYFTDEREIDGENRNLNFNIEAENGVSTIYSNTVNGLSSSISLKYDVNISSVDTLNGLTNTFSVTPNSASTNKLFESYEGFKLNSFPGSASNFFNLGTFYGGNPNFRQILFSNYGDDIEFSSDKSITLSANIEEGFSATVTEADGKLGQIAVNYSGINLQVNDNTDTNLTSIYPTYTDYQRKLITQEGFEGNYVQFNTGATETSLPGKLKWNDVDGTLDLGLKGGNVTLQVGQETLIRVVNKTSGNLLESQYKCVRVRTQAEGGAAGQRLAVVLAQADSKANHSGVLGLVTENINNNQEGFITTFGYVRDIDTRGTLQGEDWNDGDVLYLSETVAGGLTNIEPTNHPVQVGYVVYAHQNNGKIFVRVSEGVDELHELHDVSISTGVTNSQTLSYNSTLGIWENQDETLLQTTRGYSTYRATTNSIVSIGNTVGYNLGVGQTARTLTGNEYERKLRIGVVSLTGANQTTSYRNAALHFTLDGIEYFEQSFGNAEGMTTGGVRAVHGIFTSVGVISGNIEYNTLTNLIGVCRLSSSDNWHIIHNDNAGTATTIDLGSDFPANVTQEVFTYRITPKGTDDVDVTFTRQSTGAQTTVNITSNIPSTAVLYTGKGALNNNTSTVAVGFDFFAVTELFK